MRLSPVINSLQRTMKNTEGVPAGGARSPRERNRRLRLNIYQTKGRTRSPQD